MYPEDDDHSDCRQCGGRRTIEVEGPNDIYGDGREVRPTMVPCPSCE